MSLTNADVTALTAFIGARLDEDEAASWAVHDVARCDALLYEEDMADAARRDPDCDCGMPARVQREIEAKRRILAEVVEQIDDMDARIEGEWGSGNYATGESDLLLSLLALPYAGHSDYRPEWAPTTPAR